MPRDRHPAPLSVPSRKRLHQVWCKRTEASAASGCGTGRRPGRGGCSSHVRSTGQEHQRRERKPHFYPLGVEGQVCLDGERAQFPQDFIPFVYKETMRGFSPYLMDCQSKCGDENSFAWSPRRQPILEVSESFPFGQRVWLSWMRVPEALLVFMGLWVGSDWLPTHLYAIALKEHGLLYNRIQQE